MDRRLKRGGYRADCEKGGGCKGGGVQGSHVDVDAVQNIRVIFTLNYLVNRQISRAGGKLVAFFVDLRAAFDSVDRGKLIEAMRDRGVREGLIDRCEDMVRETRNRVRVGEMVGESFWTGRGVRQGCPLSPHLFNLLMADLEEELRRGRWGD